MEQHVEKLKVAENKVLIIRGVSSVAGRKPQCEERKSGPVPSC